MNLYETSATVGQEGQIRLAGVPFAPGTEVEVSVSPKRRTAAEFAAMWTRVCEELRRTTTAEPTDEEITREIVDYRSGR
jgi:hypothetical protein